MQTTRYFCVSALLMISAGLLGQVKDSLHSDLMFYGDVMINASQPEHRTRADAAFFQSFKTYLKQNPDWRSDALSMPWVTEIVPADSLFKIVTWQVEEDASYRYRGFVLFPPDQQRPIIELKDTRPLNSEYTTYGPGQWYGALYYGIQPFKTTSGDQAYIILGFNAYNDQLNQRVADVLVIDGENITFGSPVFWTDSARTELRSRVILEYADAAAGTMRFDREKEMLIYDNVIPVNTPEGTTLVPDGSYFGYQYKNGHWELITKVFTLILDAPPGGRAKEAVSRDIFGNPVRKKEK